MLGCAVDLHRRRIVNHSKNCAVRQDAAANILKGKLRAVIVTPLAITSSAVALL